MFSQRTIGMFRILTLCQGVLTIVLFWVLLFLFQVLYVPPNLALDRYLIYCGCLVMGVIIAGGDTSRAGKLLKGDFFSIHEHSLRQCLWGAAFLLVFLVAAKDKMISRVFLFSFLPVLYFAFLTSNYFLPRRLAAYIFSGDRKEKTILIGSVAKAVALKPWLDNKAKLGLHVLGIVTEEAGGRKATLPVLGAPENLETIIRQTGAVVLIAVGYPWHNGSMARLTQLCEYCGVRLLLATDFEEIFYHSVNLVEDDGRIFLGLREEPLENPLSRALKRSLDLVISLPVVLLVLPFTTVAVWIVQRFQSPGPIFFTQERAGFHNRTFKIIKYRTMHVFNDNEARQATADDDRIYPVGRWLRRLSIDEFPQFINVLRGEMSVVGPRPHLLQHNDQFAQLVQNYHVRSVIKPGISGLAQVRGFRGETSSYEALQGRIQSDIYYLENWSLTLDLSIIARTFAQLVFPPKSAQ